MFKEKRSGKLARALRKRDIDAAENKSKSEVRTRDRWCRFPACGCGLYRLAKHVSHSKHKGMGGNPTGDRSDRKLMMLLCSARHRENTVSVDQGTVRWTPLTKDGADGPVKWEVHMESVGRTGGWRELARETSKHTYEPFNDTQRQILTELAVMLV